MPTLSQMSAGILVLSAALSAHANIEVKFVESAPKDSFVIKNIGACTFNELEFEIDLAPSTGKLIFDTTAAGAGVEVFQPFEVKSGEIALASADAVSDGDKSLSVNVSTLEKDDSVSFTIDVDDTLPKSSLGQIRVTGSEIQGATVSIDTNENSAQVLVAAFDDKGVALIKLPSCS